MPSVSFWVFVVLDFIYKKRGFFCSLPNWTHFCIFYFFFILLIFGDGRGWVMGTGDSNSSKQHQIELKFCPQIVLELWKCHKEFLWYPKFWVFGANVTPIYLLKIAKIKNSHQVIQINQNQDPISFRSVLLYLSFCQRSRGHSLG